MTSPEPLDLKQEVQGIFDGPLREAVLKVLNKAYEDVRDGHHVELGFNDRTFGYNVYELAVFGFRGLVSSGVFPHLSIDEGNVLRLRTGSLSISCHKVGRYAFQDIEEHFPRQDSAAFPVANRKAIAFGHSSLFPGWREDSFVVSDDLDNLVIAHLGNSNDGLTAVYVCKPGKIEGGRIREWEWHFPLWVANASTLARRDPDISDVEKIIKRGQVRKKERPQGDIQHEG